jgi:hypothetical protein
VQSGRFNLSKKSNQIHCVDVVILTVGIMYERPERVENKEKS